MTVDVSAELDGYFAAVGGVSPAASRLLEATRLAQGDATRAARAGRSPSVPSYDDGQRFILNEGLVLAIEPFLSTSADHVIDDADGWTLRTADASLVAQFEHTIVVTRGEPIVLTAVERH